MTVFAPRTDVDTHVRDVADDELRAYWDQGWVRLEDYVHADLAAELLEAAKTRLTREREHPRYFDRVSDQFDIVYNGGRDELIEPFASLLRAPTMGRNAKKLMRGRGAALHSDILGTKMPKGEPGSGATHFHQDAYFPLDRTGQLIFWLALDHMTPEMGTMRFLAGSHREGAVGREHDDNNPRYLLDKKPYLEQEYPMTAPMTLSPGECIVLNVNIIHGAPANETERPRWCYIMNYHPTDARWTGAPGESAFVRDTDVREPGDLIRSDKFYYFPDE